MIARVATFNRLDPEDLDPRAVELLRQTVRSQPGFRAGYHMSDPKGGKALSVIVFESMEGFAALRAAMEQRPEGQRVGIEPDSAEFFEVTEF